MHLFVCTLNDIARVLLYIQSIDEASSFEVKINDLLCGPQHYFRHLTG
jgi:hypothetical protein